jgi:hypothetical protein
MRKRKTKEKPLERIRKTRVSYLLYRRRANPSRRLVPSINANRRLPHRPSINAPTSQRTDARRRESAYDGTLAQDCPRPSGPSAPRPLGPSAPRPTHSHSHSQSNPRGSATRNIDPERGVSDLTCNLPRALLPLAPLDRESMDAGRGDPSWSAERRRQCPGKGSRQVLPGSARTRLSSGLPAIGIPALPGNSRSLVRIVSPRPLLRQPP